MKHNPPRKHWCGKLACLELVMGFDSHKAPTEPTHCSPACPPGTRAPAQRAARAPMEDAEDAGDARTDLLLLQTSPGAPGSLPHTLPQGWAWGSGRKHSAFLPGRWTGDIPAPEKAPSLPAGMGFHPEQCRGFLQVSYSSRHLVCAIS